MESPSVAVLPPDLLHLICVELAASLDFASLYNCAVSSKQFANSGAIVNLYRISNDAPVKGGGSENLSAPERELNAQKWSILWRTTILSCLGRTMYPYCRYLKQLDLRDLHFLLDDDRFRGKIEKNFWAGPLAQFNAAAVAQGEHSGPRRTMAHKAAKIRAILPLLGDVVVRNSPMLEEITEPVLVGDLDKQTILSSGLVRWIPELSRLQSLEFGDGKPLADEEIRNLLHAHCPLLSRLAIYTWPDDESDHHLAEFISNMPRNTLTRFENIGRCGIGVETCLAFNTHGRSLTTLEIALADDGIDGLGKLQDCTSLQVLKLTDLGPQRDLESTQKDTFQELVNWLKACTKLREISLQNFSCAPAILLPVLEEPNIHLDDLEIGSGDNAMYTMKDYRAFHVAIGRHRTIRSLTLKADPDPYSPEDVEIFCSALCSLKELQYLKLTRVSDYFQDSHIQLISENLSSLEELTVGGWQLRDPSLEKMHKLQNLKSVTLTGPSSFTANGLLDFVAQLNPSNGGLSITIDQAVTETLLSGAELELVQDTLTTKVQGRLYYNPITDPDMSEYSGSDSD